MYDWLAELVEQDQAHCFTLASGGASEAELEALERDYQLRLPHSYRAFMQRWDGGEFYGLKLFSVEELRWQIENNYRFLPYPGKLVLNDEHFGPYPADYGLLYNKKPIHYFPFGEPLWSSDVWCFDTARSLAGEHPVCFYDHECISLKEILEVRYPLFEAMVFYECYQTLKDHEFDLRGDDEDRSLAKAWRTQIAGWLEALGVQDLKRYRLTWRLAPDLYPPDEWVDR